MRDKIMEKGKQIKEELTEFIGESTEIFLRKYYGYCYKNYVEYEATTLLVEDENLEGFSSEKILEKIIECKKKIGRIPYGVSADPEVLPACGADLRGFCRTSGKYGRPSGAVRGQLHGDSGFPYDDAGKRAG